MFECTICTEEFKNTSEVVSTTCGHIFHQHCLRAWTSRSGNCPQCRSANPEHHKIFLNFDEAVKILSDTVKFRASLEAKERQILSVDESHVLEVSRLENQLEENERLCFKLNENIEFLRVQHASIEQENVLKSVENHSLGLKILSLEGKLARRNTENEQLRGLIDDFTKKGSVGKNSIVGAEENKEAALLAQNENTALKRKLKCEVQEKIMLLEQNNALEEKLKQIQLQLQQEIRHSTALSVDKMRLQSRMERTTGYGDPAENRDPKQEDAVNKDRKNKVDNSEIAAPSSAKPIHNGVIIKGLKGKFSPRQTVLKLAQQMQLCVGEDDIEQTIVRKRLNNIYLIVGLKTKALKDLILSHADKLKDYPETQHFEISAYSATTDLLAYAMKLKSGGYKSIYIYKDQVCCRVDNKSMPIKIFNKETVDRMMECRTKSHTKQGSTPELSKQLPQLPGIVTKNSASPACSDALPGRSGTGCNECNEAFYVVN